MVQLNSQARWWECDGHIRIGTDPRHSLCLIDPPAGLQAWFRLLERPTPPQQAMAGLRELVGQEEARTFWAALREHHLLTAPATAPGVVRIIGDADAVGLLHPVLGAHHRVVHTRHLGQGQPQFGEASICVVVADTVEPDRMWTELLRRHEEPHLVVRPVADGVEVGPVVIPGVTSCVGCADQWARDHDAAWPRTLLTLQTTRLAIPEPLRGWWPQEVLAEVQSVVEGGHPSLLERSVSIQWPAATRRRHDWPVHPACGCRRPEGG